MAMAEPATQRPVVARSDRIWLRPSRTQPPDEEDPAAAASHHTRTPKHRRQAKTPLPHMPIVAPLGPQEPNASAHIVVLRQPPNRAEREQSLTTSYVLGFAQWRFATATWEEGRVAAL